MRIRILTLSRETFGWHASGLSGSPLVCHLSHIRCTLLPPSSSLGGSEALVKMSVDARPFGLD